MMTNRYVWIGMAAGLFIAGIGIGYAVFVNTYNPYAMMTQPQYFNQMMSGNPQLASQYMGYMVQNPQLRQQMYSYMFQNQDFMNGMMGNPQWSSTIMSNPQLSNQWMGTMMQNPQFRQQYLGPQMMMQNPQFARSMMGQWYSQQNTTNQGTSSLAVDTDKVSIAKDSWQSNSTKWYLPDAIQVPVGTTVTWTNSDSIIHTVTDVGGAFDSGLMQPNGIWSHTFNTKGQYQYFCTLHPWMKGEVIVS